MDESPTGASDFEDSAESRVAEKVSGDTVVDEGKMNLALPLILSLLYMLIGLFFLRPSMGDPDSYRQALSALDYIERGLYTAYWDFPLTMYTFVVGTRLASALCADQLITLNVIAVLLGALTVWPLYQIVRRIVNPQAAAFAALAYIFSPTLIRFSTYLSHEIVGFACAIWSVYLFERAIARESRLIAFFFGLLFGATCVARTNGAAFIVPPLIVLFFARKGGFNWPVIRKLVPIALLGVSGCALLIHRPTTVLRFEARIRTWFFTYYEIGQFLKRTTLTALDSLTPALMILALIAAIVLVVRRKYFTFMFGAVWFFTVYLFYVGMDYCRLKFFLVVVPPCLLIVFAGADQIDEWIRARGKKFIPAAKLVVLMVLLLVSLGPSLSYLMPTRQVNDDKIAAEQIGEIVRRELLFIAAFQPAVKYYNRDAPPETIYVITEHRPGELRVDMKGLNLALARLREGRPVFIMDIFVKHFELLGIEAVVEPVWEYKSRRMYHITELDMINARITSIGGE